MPENQSGIDPIARHSIARSMDPWHHKERDDLDPQGDTLAEVIDRWMACRATILDVGRLLEHSRMSQHRYCLTDMEVRHLAEHVEKWLALSNPPGAPS